VHYQFMNFRDLGDLERSLQTIAQRLPPSVELVVGIPRSGLLAASILALNLNLPLTDVTGFLEGRVLARGSRPVRAGGERHAGPSAVVIDDSVATGGQMKKTRAEIEAAGRGDDVVYAAAFVSPGRESAVDLHGEVVNTPRAFAWMLLHNHNVLARSCVDIDGVLCLDPTESENDDGPAYAEFLAGAQPLFIPSAPVRYLVTSRLEKYREATEGWLGRHGIEYEELVMLDLPDAAARRAQGAHAGHKADFYRRSDADLFIESDYRQAAEIAARSGRQVFAMDRREMIYPSPMRALAGAPGPFARSVARQPPARAIYLRLRRLGQALAPHRFTSKLRKML
jgi:uncharacterized HAD superfamily protein